MTIIGMDPGMSGAIAFLSESGELIGVEDMPIFTRIRRVGGKDQKKNHVNVHVLGDMVRQHVADGSSAIIELVGPMPRDGAMQAFQFGFGAGALHGVCGALGLSIRTATPQAWKKHFGLLKADKGASRHLATRRFPARADLFKRVKDDGRAEAVLIALYYFEARITPERFDAMTAGDGPESLVF